MFMIISGLASDSRLNHESSPDDSASLGAMVFLVRKLDELLQTEDGKKSIIKKFRDDVVGSIYTKMEKLSEVHDPPLTVNYWMKDVRELSYDMADFINELVVDAHDAEVKVDQISEFEELVKYATELYDCYNLENSVYHDSESLVLRPHLGWVYAETEHVGMDNRIKDLRSLVMPKGDDEEDRQLKVVSILGVDQGVGRSTLAQKLWRESETEFGTCRAFVLMARKPDIRMTLGSILSQIRPLEAPGDYTVPYLTHDIRTHLQDKRLLLGPTRCLICSTSQCIYSLLVCLVKKINVRIF